jgi:hypothetical protein
MYLSEDLNNKWAEVLDVEDLPKITDPYRRAVTAILLENTLEDLEQQYKAGQGLAFLSEAAPINSMGASAADPTTGNIKAYNPILIGMLRRAAPSLISFDLCGTQPMNGPTGLIFCLRAAYSTQAGDEALFDEADTDFAGKGTHANHGFHASATTGTTVTTAEGEALGDGSVGVGDSGHFQQMAFRIDRITATAGTRALKGEYTLELAQDLQKLHGLDAETEIINILSTEIISEINREVVRTIYDNATVGAQHNTAVAGTFNLDSDANGRWMEEKFKGLYYQIEREANAIMIATRRGRGNVIVCSADIASAFNSIGYLDSKSAYSATLEEESIQNTYAGVLNGKYKVFIDPYIPVGATNYFCIGYRGSSPYDAGLFYCPYVPLQMVRAVGENTFQPKVAFKTRYALVSNPFANSGGAGALTSDANIYYRKVTVSNIM